MRKVRAGQVCARAAVFSAEKQFMRFQNVREFLPVVLDAFRFSQSHSQSSSNELDLVSFNFTGSSWPWKSLGTSADVDRVSFRGAKRRGIVACSLLYRNR